MKKFSADMKVVRFGAEDVIVTSGAPDMVFDSTMGDGREGNGIVTFNGASYTLDGRKNWRNLLNAIGTKYGIGYNGALKTTIESNSSSEELQLILENEMYEGLGSGWVGDYMYNATSNTFTRQ